MKNYQAIVRKELHNLFVSPIAYAVLAVFLFITGWFFYLSMTVIIQQVTNQALSSPYGPPPPIDVPDVIRQNFFSVVSTIMLFFIPMLTMGAFADERRSGTIELLFTAPLTNLQLVLGKFSAAFLFFLIMLAPTSITSLVLYLVADPAPAFGPVWAGYLGVLLLGGGLIAFGIFISSLTENQLVASAVTFSLFLMLWVIDASAGASSDLFSEVVGYISVLNHYEDFVSGVLDTQHLVFYLSLIFLGLYLTAASLDSRKWRQ